MRILHLTLKKKWFDMVGNGKEEEYRELTPFWISRLCDFHKGSVGGLVFDFHKLGCHTLKEFDRVLFANGGHFGDVPKKLFEFNGIEIREGSEEWGAEPGKKYFVIKLGKQL